MVGPYVLVVWVGNFDNTPNPLLVGGDVAAPLFTDIAQALASDAVPFDDLVPVQQEGLNITRETVCTRPGISMSPCAGTPPKRGIFRSFPHAIIGRIPHHPH